VLDYLSIKI